MAACNQGSFLEHDEDVEVVLNHQAVDVDEAEGELLAICIASTSCTGRRPPGASGRMLLRAESQRKYRLSACIRRIEMTSSALVASCAAIVVPDEDNETALEQPESELDTREQRPVR